MNLIGGTVSSSVPDRISSPVQHDAMWRGVHPSSHEQPTARAASQVQHGPLDFDDIPDTVPSRRDIESGLISEAELSHVGWVP